MINSIQKNANNLLSARLAKDCWCAHEEPRKQEETRKDEGRMNDLGGKAFMTILLILMAIGLWTTLTKVTNFMDGHYQVSIKVVTK